MWFSKPDVEKLEQDKDVGRLIKALKYKKDRGIRSIAADALGNIGDAKAVKPLIAALKDKDGVVRWRAAGALAAIGATEAIGPLEALAQNDPDDDARWAAQQALQFLRGK